MKNVSAHQKIMTIINQLQVSDERLNTNQLLNLLEHVENICIDKTTVALIISSVKSLMKRDISDTRKLTDREKEVVLLISKGLKNDAIAKYLNLSKSTIETHRKNIRKKLKLTGNDSLFAFALVFSLQSKSYQVLGEI